MALKISGMFSRLQLVLALLGFVCSSLLVGCGPNHPKTYPVFGKVVFQDGTPAKIGTVEFRLKVPLDGQTDRIMARGKLDDQGRFSLTTFEPNDGALAGDYQVVIHQFIVTEDKSFESHNHGRRVPSMYADYGYSDLTAKVVATTSDTDRTSNAITLTLRDEPADKQDE